MSAYSNGSLFGTMVRWLIVGFLALIAIKVGLALLGVMVGLAMTLLFTFGPLMLLGWAVLKFVRYFTRPAPEPI